MQNYQNIAQNIRFYNTAWTARQDYEIYFKLPIMINEISISRGII